MTSYRIHTTDFAGGVAQARIFDVDISECTR